MAGYNGIAITEPFFGLIAGVALIAIAIIGRLEIKELKVGPISPIPRVVCGLFGAALLYVYFFQRQYYINPSMTENQSIPQSKLIEQSNTAANPTKESTNESTRSQAQQIQQNHAASDLLKNETGSEKSYGVTLQKAEHEWNDLKKQLRDEIEKLKKINKEQGIQAQSPSNLSGQEKKLTIENKVKLQKNVVENVNKAISAKGKVVSELIENAPSSVSISLDKAKHLPIIGYVMFAEIDHDNSIRKSFFTIEGDKVARFPGPNDVIVSKNRKIALRAYPYHWDPEQKQTVKEGEPLIYVSMGQKLKVGGDVFISTDPHNKHQYAIAPITQTIDHEFTSSEKVYSAYKENPSLAGYVYLGLIDEKSGGFTDRFFENKTNPDITIPAPGDKLLAKRDTNLRKGPRYWDNAKGDYVFPPISGVIKAGETVVVGGDTLLAKQGQSIWTPVSRE